MTKNFYFHTFFWYLKKIKTFRDTTKKSENKNLCHFLLQSIILESLGQEGLTKFFLLGFS